MTVQALSERVDKLEIEVATLRTTLRQIRSRSSNGDMAVDSKERQEARERLIVRMEQGVDLGGQPYPTREEIYAERIDHIGKNLG